MRVIIPLSLIILSFSYFSNANDGFRRIERERETERNNSGTWRDTMRATNKKSWTIPSVDRGKIS